MNKIKVLHVITSLDMGGAERMLSNLVCSMDRNIYENIVISLKGLGFWGRYLQQHGITVYALNMRPSIKSLFKLFQLRRVIRRHKPDYIQGWMYHANVVALLIGKLSGIEKILWNIRCSNMDLSKYGFNTRIIYRLGSNLSARPFAIINNSRTSIRQHSTDGYTNKRLLYVPNGFDLNKFKPDKKLYNDFRRKHGLPITAKLIGMFARFDPMKDHATFLHAAGILSKIIKDVYFVLAGKGLKTDNFALMRMIKQNDLQNRVILLGMVQDMHAVFPAMDFVTQTSVFGEGFPNVIGEAMACGVPCFCTDVGDSLALIGDVGFKIDVRDSEGLAKAWQNALKSSNEAEMRLKVRERIRQNFSISHVAELYSQIYV